AGKMAFFTDIRVVDTNGQDVRPGEVGEVILSGPNVMAGYWGHPDETATVLHDGWFHSGDAATVDDEGYLYIQDRYTDMIISGGENVYPAEVESALLELDGIIEAAVVAAPDEKWGEVGAAVVVSDTSPAPAEQHILDQLRVRLA